VTSIGGGTGSGSEVMISSASTAVPPEGLISAHDLNLIEKLYEPKANKKLIRVLTVIAYCICVSLIAILLSLYYLFIWNPYNKTNQKLQQQQHLQRQQEGTVVLLQTTAPSLLLKPAALGTTKSNKVVSRTSSLLESDWRSPLELPSVAASAQRNSQLLSTNGGDKLVLMGTSADNRLEDPFTLYAKAKRAREREKRDKLFHAVHGNANSST